MKKKQFLTIILITVSTGLSYGQQETYKVKLAPFSSDRYDEFSPAYFRNGIIFTTNRQANSFIEYSSSVGEVTFDMNYIDTIGNVKWRKSVLFSRNLNTKLNDGPATFNSTFDTIYFTRNLRSEGNLKDINTEYNKLGIFNAVFKGNRWELLSEFRYNSEWYNISSPCLSHDGSTLYFSSDRPGGFGGSDIYYCQKKDGYWDEPVNLGPQVNTKGNETYPFINASKELFFSSDGHQGLGGKDIFVTMFNGSGWYPVLNLEAPLNSKADDFGIITDSLSNKGYFSSNRGKTLDIFQFESKRFQFWFSEPQIENQNCFEFSDTGSIIVDTIRYQYVWDFGDGSKKNSEEGNHCYNGTGIFKITHDIIDRITGKVIFQKFGLDIEILKVEQPFINSPDEALEGDSVVLDGLESFCPDYDITGYYWDFGDGHYDSGPVVSHKFMERGKYEVKLGLVLTSQKTGYTEKRAVSKNISILANNQDRSHSHTVVYKSLKETGDLSRNSNIRIIGYYSAEQDLTRDAVFQVVIRTSPVKLGLTSQFFRNVPGKYKISELHDSIKGSYSYIADQQMTLMEALPAFNELITEGYRDAIVRLQVLKDPSEKELYRIKKNYGVLSDIYFDNNNRLTTSAYVMLEQIANFMHKYPNTKLEAGVHTDNQGALSNNLLLTQLRAQVIVTFLINRGINSNRLIPKGYGSTRPVSSNSGSVGRKLNRRIDFTLF